MVRNLRYSLVLKKSERVHADCFPFEYVEADKGLGPVDTRDDRDHVFDEIRKFPGRSGNDDSDKVESTGYVSQITHVGMLGKLPNNTP